MAVNSDSLAEAVADALRSASAQARTDLQNELAGYAKRFPGTWHDIQQARSPMLRKLVRAIIEGVA